MLAEADLAEYLDEIRQQVCSHCVERPPGGPPCAPLGKECGIELHLPKLIDTIHEVHSNLIDPYLQNNRQKICQGCPHLHSSICPCPMDYLAVLLVDAVESVDRRRDREGKGHQLIAALPGEANAGLDDVFRAYEQATGRWTGCDWPTWFGSRQLDLNGWTAAEAQTLALETSGTEEAEEWCAAAAWLARVEEQAARAEAQAALAVAAANAGEWPEAVAHARRARACEFATSRTIWRGFPATWEPLCKTIEKAAKAHADKEPKAAAQHSETGAG